jgi:hypothetical protein
MLTKAEIFPLGTAYQVILQEFPKKLSYNMLCFGVLEDIFRMFFLLICYTEGSKSPKNRQKAGKIRGFASFLVNLTKISMGVVNTVI